MSVTSMPRSRVRRACIECASLICAEPVSCKTGAATRMAFDAKMIAAWDRASAPISRYFDLIESLVTGGDERQIVRGLRCLDKELSSLGIRSENPALYRPSSPIALWLVTAMLDDLAARTAIAAARIGEAVQEIGRLTYSRIKL